MNNCNALIGKNSFPLTMASEGERVQISFLSGSPGLEARLVSLGLNLGSELEVLHRLGGNTVVRRGESRLALGAGMAHKVMVIAAQ